MRTTPPAKKANKTAIAAWSISVPLPSIQPIIIAVASIQRPMRS
ncbi:MAG: hypothetical protein N2235_17935 [Fischerella sp.]|nr:hypothetical protein [Fischerella sp.]